MEAALACNEVSTAASAGAFLVTRIPLRRPYIGRMSSVRVKVVEGEIVVTDPVTEWWVSYRHSTAT